ncbi:MAG: hypothetical protein A2805_00630 [Candidatus Andersenbacteria bacterium RIFCSPHIGHO2_01_FULL_46_36]|uniref:Anti-sigma K factor RskA C-terminal domain-containing protein n=1 Tax=Candidatus Andersenbacteria bacterium RIFCSPHIGHO2_12_FULL_45_11 TaxID=1797281 RepID=A0A1G1WZH3_9BACT|nr:MAG: hypothetical protein A2805_00630 [Candidatus Andersenbacteria bacterium RIFCSPHIGHO2_01_FULL_46_36]OGY33104.1 MAG: hypothetical protein A3D99_01445 [Candidatus Andersenbacteria bacterium RIFCSPHIGHO2_12_FULL_45_11]
MQLGVIGALLLVAVGGSVYRHVSTTAQPNPPEQLPADVVLELDAKVKKFSITTPLAELPSGQSYHLWLIPEDKKSPKYAGEMFPVTGGKYSITFTSEESLGDYRTALVSQEATEFPEKPAHTVKEWLLR